MAFMLVHFFCLLEFKFRFGFYFGLKPFPKPKPKSLNLLPSLPCLAQQVQPSNPAAAPQPSSRLPCAQPSRPPAQLTSREAQLRQPFPASHALGR
jgi:hypothetical protein